jgi:hypothetical protein
MRIIIQSVAHPICDSIVRFWTLHRGYREMSFDSFTRDVFHLLGFEDPVYNASMCRRLLRKYHGWQPPALSNHNPHVVFRMPSNSVILRKLAGRSFVETQIATVTCDRAKIFWFLNICGRSSKDNFSWRIPWALLLTNWITLVVD